MRRRAAVVLLACVLALGADLARPPASTDAVSLGVCTVSGTLQFQSPIPRFVPAPVEVNLMATSAVGGCLGVGLLGNSISQFTFLGFPNMSCLLVEGVVATTVQFAHSPPSGVAGVQSQIVGNATAGGFVFALFPQTNPAFITLAEFVVTTANGALCLAGSPPAQVNVVGVVELASQ